MQSACKIFAIYEEETICRGKQNKRMWINGYNISRNTVKEYEFVVLILIDAIKEHESASSIWIHGLEN